MDNNFSGIYAIVNKENGHRYIGSSINIHSRWVRYKRRLRKKKHTNNYLQNAWNKYGKNAFDFIVLERVDSKEELIDREQHYIDRIDPEYNICKVAGSTLGVPCLERTKKAVAEASRNRVITEEYRKKMSEALRGRVITEAHREKISKALTGKQRSEQTKNKVSKGLKEYYKTHKQPSTPRTEDVKRKVSEGLKAYYANGGKTANMRRVKQYSIEGDFIAEFESINEAGRELGMNPTNIPACCRGKQKTSGGYVWRYAEDEAPNVS